MASKTSVGGYLCSSCGWAGRNWFGRCPGCGEWSSATAAAEQDGGLTLSPLLLPEGDEGRLSTGRVELDRVLGGGFVAGEVVLLAGEPGIGKSTLVLQLLDGLNQGGARTLLVTGEESVGQVALRGARLGVD